MLCICFLCVEWMRPVPTLRLIIPRLFLAYKQLVMELTSLVSIMDVFLRSNLKGRPACELIGTAVLRALLLTRLK